MDFMFLCFNPLLAVCEWGQTEYVHIVNEALLLVPVEWLHIHLHLYFGHITAVQKYFIS